MSISLFLCATLCTIYCRCVLHVAGKASDVVLFVLSLECRVLRTVLQLFERQFEVVDSTSVNRTDEQKKLPTMQLTSAEMLDRFRKIVVTSVNFVLFSG